ncbi:hypothetical protein BT93_E1841 [Corymbia citriodora subsp. variegata]|nr:hypothetical protein BT93_E1841 [Corymbia citriodora subsp. variegata]
MQVREQQPLFQAQQQLILQNLSGSFRFSSNMLLSREDKEMSRSALSTFRAKEEEIERKKMEQNGSEDDSGQDKATEEQETGSVWSGRHCSCPGTSVSSTTICFWLLHWQLVWLFVLDGIHVCVERNWS